MKLCLLTDSHTGCRNGSEVIQNYQNRFYSEVFFPYMKAHNIKHILHLGDFFDNRKFLAIKCLHSNRKAFLEPLRDLGIHMDIILGNHDTVHKNTNEVNSLKEVFGFFVNSIDIITEPRELTYGSMKIGALPWIAPDNIVESMKFLERTDAKVLISHLELAGFEMMKGMPVAVHGMESTPFQKFDAVYSGHYHTKSSKGNIHYLGTPFELTWADCHDPKYFHILDTETGELTPVHNPLTIHKKIYYDDSVKKPDIEVLERLKLQDCFVKLFIVKKTDFYHFDQYFQKLQAQNPYDLKIAETFEEERAVDDTEETEPTENTQSLLEHYVDKLETDLDKTCLKQKLIALFTEAQSLETI